MHHSLRFYSRHVEAFLRLYIFAGKLTRLPVLGKIVRGIATRYGSTMHASYVLTLEEAKAVVDLSTNVALGPCRCREVFRNCDRPAQGELVIGVGTAVFGETGDGGFEPITKEEAKAVLELCHEKGLFHTLVRCHQDFYALCNCCTCCCVPTRLRRDYQVKTCLVRDKDVVSRLKG